MSDSTAVVGLEWHRRYLRRYIKLQVGAPEGFTCRGGWHEAIVEIGDFPGTVETGSLEEQIATPFQNDRRWPQYCDGLLLPLQ